VDLNQKREFSDGLFNQSHGSFELVLAPVILALIGLGLDRWLGTIPVFTIVLAVAGMVGSWAKQYYTYRSAIDEQRARRAGAGLP
jgi:F0F1-type ATP synthase assembly protein I